MSDTNQFSKNDDLWPKFEAAVRKAGWETKDIYLLANNEELCKEILSVLRGRSEIRLIEYIVDFDVGPMTPQGFEIRPEDQINGRRNGKWIFSRKELSLHLAKKQKYGRTLVGNDLKDELDREPVMGAQLLDFYLRKPHLIPEEWKRKSVFFWGTIYRGTNGCLYVRYLYWDGAAWDSDYLWLARNFGCRRPALVAK